MFYTRRSRWQKFRNGRLLTLVVEAAAGLHAADGLAHGVPPSRESRAR